MIPAIREEQMAPFFTKFHLNGPWPFAAVLHRFTAADGGDPHDHPWGFQVHILAGGYVEEIYDLRLRRKRLKMRQAGASFRNEAGHVHRIVQLLAPEVWTLILPGPWERKPGFYQVRPDGVGRGRGGGGVTSKTTPTITRINITDEDLTDEELRDLIENARPIEDDPDLSREQIMGVINSPNFEGLHMTQEVADELAAAGISADEVVAMLVNAVKGSH